jgi:3-oxoacyl-[acyl-carrier protein] reductase
VKLENRVALITGGGSGLGRQIALNFAREGARIAVNDVRPEAAGAVCEEIRKNGGAAIPLVADVSDSVEVHDLFDQIDLEWSRLDILVNNAGIAVVTDEVRARMANALAQAMSGQRPEETIGATRDMTDAHWRRTLSIHVDGTFYCTREALRRMEPRGYGKIINMASIAGLMGFAGSPDYSAAKAAIIGLTRAVGSSCAASTSMPSLPASSTLRCSTCWARASARSWRCRRRSDGSGPPRRSPTWPCTWPRTTRPSPSVR